MVSLVALALCLLLLLDWVISEFSPGPSWSKAAVNHVERSLESLICFSASERILNACCNLSSSASVTTVDRDGLDLQKILSFKNARAADNLIS
jgi:hypothetical protein